MLTESNCAHKRRQWRRLSSCMERNVRYIVSHSGCARRALHDWITDHCSSAGSHCRENWVDNSTLPDCLYNSWYRRICAAVTRATEDNSLYEISDPRNASGIGPPRLLKGIGTPRSNAKVGTKSICATLRSL